MIEQVLDHGYVRLRNLAGPTRRIDGGLGAPFRDFDADDIDPAQAARMSFEGMNKDVIVLKDGTTRPRTREDDIKLSKYLLTHDHTSPFEMIQVWIEVMVPIFVDRHWVRHRVWRRNESSGRYIVLPDKWYIPEVVGGKAPNKKQGQEDNLPEGVQNAFKSALDINCRQSYSQYTTFMDAGVAPEHARMFLHLNHYVHWLGNVDLGNMFKFLKLRDHGHAQIETQQYARAIIKLLDPHLPELMKLYREVVRGEDSSQAA